MRSLFIAFFILIPFVSFAQKHDFLWTLGVGPKVNPSSPKTFFFNFHTDPPSILLRNDSVPMGYTSSYSNEKGEIIAFTNGLRMYNKNGQLMENGEGLNLTLHQHFDSFYYDYPTLQSAFFLEHPDNPDRLYFISTDVGKHPQPSFFYKYVGRRIVVATIDVKANNGLGRIVKKDEAIIEGNLCTPAAVRHANGRDWWIFCSDADTTRHYRVLLSPEGFSKPEVQWIGSKPNPVGEINNITGNSFSPKGSWYIDRNDFLGFSIFEFDRCTGQLSNERRLSYAHTPQQIEYKNYPHGYGSGNVFSPDERFLYTTVTWSYYLLNAPFSIEEKPFLFQYDLTTPDWQKSVDTLNYNNPLEYLPNKKYNYQVFWGAEMGPDGRIYFVHHRGGYCSVQYPNRKGKASTVYIDQPWFDIDMNGGIPCMPNYRLGPLDGSSCDTLGIDNVPVAYFRVDDSLGKRSRFFYDLSYYEPAQWLWDFGDGTQDTAQNALHTYKKAGYYNVCLTVKNTNGSNTSCRWITIDTLTSGSTSPEMAELRVWPNPAQDFITVQVQENTTGHWLLHDLSGRLIGSGLWAGTQQQIDVSSLISGFYVFTLVEQTGVRRLGKFAVLRRE